MAQPREKFRLAIWVAGAIAALALFTVALTVALHMSVTAAVQAAGSAVLIIVTVIYVRATQDLVSLERERSEFELVLRRVKVARTSRRGLRALLSHLDRIADLTRCETLEDTLSAIRGKAVGREIESARQWVDSVYDTCSTVVDDEVSDDYNDGGSTAAEYAEGWLDLLDLIRRTQGADLDEIWTTGGTRRSGPERFRDAAYDGKPAASDAEGLRTGKWAMTTSQAVFNASDAMTTYIDNKSLR